MPKEHFERLDTTIENARRNPALRAHMRRGLSAAHETFTRLLRSQDRNLKKFAGQGPLRGFESQWHETRDRILDDRRHTKDTLRKLEGWLKRVRTKPQRLEDF